MLAYTAVGSLSSDTQGSLLCHVVVLQPLPPPSPPEGRSLSSSAQKQPTSSFHWFSDPAHSLRLLPEAPCFPESETATFVYSFLSIVCLLYLNIISSKRREVLSASTAWKLVLQHLGSTNEVISGRASNLARMRATSLIPRMESTARWLSSCSLTAPRIALPKL